jgi:hypothetical protein
MLLRVQFRPDPAEGGRRSVLGSRPAAVSRVQLSPYRVALAGVRIVPVGYHDLSKDITTLDTVEFDEQKLKKIAARVKGDRHT